ncbi:DUF7109 family protein [Haloarcula salinisoli]|uniref:Uncharacterized protein n=1 Tax=Haloarcula salinisoli TaxID=2487746 RepID=A0A8J7YFI9_9EURY|nr:hypothetical protein [Halomicroarcula salinisoli]MBX0302403.1 hypothetical protein [Halomicroarcula salinisoli]
MELTPDELAGVVDVVGPVTREELVQACGELAFKRGEDVDSDAFEAAIDDALSTYHVIAVDSEAQRASKRSGETAERDHDADADAPLVVVGPAAFPEIVEGAADLPHILDVPARDPSTETVAAAAEQRFREDAAEAVRAGDDERIQALLDVSYDLEAWGPVELAEARGLLDEATHAN